MFNFVFLLKINHDDCTNHDQSCKHMIELVCWLLSIINLANYMAIDGVLSSLDSKILLTVFIMKTWGCKFSFK